MKQGNIITFKFFVWALIFMVIGFFATHLKSSYDETIIHISDNKITNYSDDNVLERLKSLLNKKQDFSSSQLRTHSSGSYVYYGVLPSETGVTDIQIQNLKYLIQDSRSVPITDFGSSGYVYFAWPASFESDGLICNAVNPTGNLFVEGNTHCIYATFGPITSFRVETLNLSDGKGNIVPYKIYHSPHPVGGSYYVK